MNAELFETFLGSVADMNEEQKTTLMAIMQAHHVFIPNYWTKADIEEIAERSIDSKTFTDFQVSMHYAKDDEQDEVNDDLKAHIDTYFKRLDEESDEEESEEEDNE